MPQPTLTLSRPTQQYLEGEINSLSPVELVIKCLDFGIAACHRRDQQRVCRVLTELIGGLNFEHEEIAGNLYRLYEYCLRCARRGDLEVTARVFRELRETWIQVAAAERAKMS